MTNRRIGDNDGGGNIVGEHDGGHGDDGGGGHGGPSPGHDGEQRENQSPVCELVTMIMVEDW